MKVTFILPSMGKKKGKTYVRNWKREPLTIAVLSKLTPPRYDREFFDDRIELIDYDTDTDIIAISVDSFSAKRAYDIAKRFREKDKIVVMGGYHITTCSDEAMEFADIVVIGNADSIWEEILLDIENNTYRKKYVGKPSINYGIPDRSIYEDKKKKYLNIGQIETGRGCFHKCQFCSVNSYYKGIYIHRKVEDIITEIKSTDYKSFYFVDDSIFSNKDFAKELFEALIPLNISWASQVTIEIARDEEILRLMSMSGCIFVLIGFETLHTDNLKLMGKAWNEKIGERDELINALHRNKIGIYASFIFGYEHDSYDTLLDIVNFCKKHGFMLSLINQLIVMPGTKTYDNLKRNNLLVSDKWWLEKDVVFGASTFYHHSLSTIELKEYTRIGNKKFFQWSSIIVRWFKQLRRDRSFKSQLVFLYLNIVFHFAINRRLNIPLGKNLDELPK